MSVVEDPAPVTAEPKIECNLASNMIHSKKDFLLGLQSSYKETLTLVNDRRNSDPNYLFVDEEFPPTNSSLVFQGQPTPGTIWRRPHQLNPAATLIKDGFSKSDIAQGNLGDCYFLAAAAALATTPKLLRKIFPARQSLSKDATNPEYNGLLRFRYWRFGKWVEVVIDDSIPTMQGFMVLYGRSTDPQEFWVSLAEKAYAKLNGSYEALNGGQNTETLEDMTGGLAIQHDMSTSDKNSVFNQVMRARRHQSFVCASLYASGETAREVEKTGLVANHAYTITGSATVKLSTGETKRILRVRNPWGTSKEWTGLFSDKSEVWSKVDDVTKKSLDYQVKGDAEWWMTLEDFWDKFSSLTICTLGPDFNEDGDEYHLPWVMSTAYGQWVPGSTAGGSRNNTTFHTNPQYLLRIKEADDAEAEAEPGAEVENQGCFVQIGLMQEHRRVNKNTMVPLYGIGLAIYKTDGPRTTKLVARDFATTPATLENGAFVQKREVTLTGTLQPGYYVMIPATFRPNCASTFFIRLFTDTAIELSEL